MSGQLPKLSQDQTTNTPSTSASSSVNFNDSQPIFFQAIVCELCKSESYTADISGINVDHLFQLHSKNSHVKDISMKFLQDQICLDVKRRFFAFMTKSPFLKSIKYSNIDKVYIYSEDPRFLMLSIRRYYESKNDGEQSRLLFLTFKCESISISQLLCKLITNVVVSEPGRLLTIKIASDAGCPILPGKLPNTTFNSSVDERSNQIVFFRAVVRETIKCIMDKSEFKGQEEKDLIDLKRVHIKEHHVGDIGIVFLEDHLCLEMNRETVSFHNVLVKYSEITQIYNSTHNAKLFGIAIEVEIGDYKKVVLVNYKCKSGSMTWFLSKLTIAICRQKPRLLTREMALDIGCSLSSPEGGELTKSKPPNNDQKTQTALYQTFVDWKETTFIEDGLTKQITSSPSNLIENQSQSSRVDNVEMSLFNDHIHFAMERDTESFHYHFVKYADISRVHLVQNNEKDILLLVETNFMNGPKILLRSGCQSESISQMLFKLIDYVISHEPSLLTEEIALDAGCPALESGKHNLNDDQRGVIKLGDGRRSQNDDLH